MANNSNRDDFLMKGADLIVPEILRKDTQFTSTKNKYCRCRNFECKNTCRENYWAHEGL